MHSVAVHGAPIALHEASFHTLLATLAEDLNTLWKDGISVVWMYFRLTFLIWF